MRLRRTSPWDIDRHVAPALPHGTVLYRHVRTGGTERSPQKQYEKVALLSCKALLLAIEYPQITMARLWYRARRSRPTATNPLTVCSQWLRGISKLHAADRESSDARHYPITFRARCMFGKHLKKSDLPQQTVRSDPYAVQVPRVRHRPRRSTAGRSLPASRRIASGAFLAT